MRAISIFAERGRLVHSLLTTTSMLLITSMLFAGAYQVPQAHAAAADITDFNGDGFEDLAIGVPYESTDAVLSWDVILWVGWVHVIYGSRDDN